MSGRQRASSRHRDESWHDAASGPGSFYGHSREGTTSSYLTGVEPDRDSYRGEGVIYQASARLPDFGCISKQQQLVVSATAANSALLHLFQVSPAEAIDYMMHLQANRSAPRPASGASLERVADANSAQVSGQNKGYQIDNEPNEISMIMKCDNSDTESGKISDLHQHLQQSYTSGTDTPDKAPTTLFTAAMLGDSSATQPCTTSDEQRTPGTCLPSPQPSPFQQLRCEMQQVAVDQHSPDRELSDRSQKLNYMLGQDQNRGSAVDGASPAPATTDSADDAVESEQLSAPYHEQRTPLLSSPVAVQQQLCAHQPITSSPPSEVAELDECPISIAQDSSAPQHPLCPLDALQPAHQSLALSAGCISDMSSMMEPCRGASPGQETNVHDVRGLLIAQCNPLYNESQDPEKGHSCHIEECEASACSDFAATSNTEDVIADKHSSHSPVSHFREPESNLPTSSPQISPAPTDLHSTRTSQSVDSVLNKILSSIDASCSGKETQSCSSDKIHNGQISELSDTVTCSDEGAVKPQVPAKVAAPSLADVCPSVLKVPAQEVNAECFAEPLADPVVLPGLTSAMHLETQSPSNRAPRLADVCPLTQASPGEADCRQSDTKAPSDPPDTPEHLVLPESVRQSPHHHLLHPPIEPAQQQSTHFEAKQPSLELEGSYRSMDPGENQVPEDPGENQDADADEPPCRQKSRGLEAQRSLLCTALAATKLRNDTQGTHTDAEDPLAPGGLPSIASMLLRNRPSMDDKRPATARTSIQSHFAISAVHKNDERSQCNAESSQTENQSDGGSAELSVCCTPRVPNHLGTPRTDIGATTQLLGVEKVQEDRGIRTPGTDINRCKSGPVSSFGQPENADSADIPVSSIWEEAAKIQRTPRTRTMLRKRADSGIAAALRKKTPGELSRSISDGCAFARADLQGYRDQPDSQEADIQQMYSNAESAYQDVPLNMASSLSEGLAKDVVITQSVQLRDASEQGATHRTHVMSPSTPAPLLAAPNTCPAALQGADKLAVGTHQQLGLNWLPLLGTSPLLDRTPSPTTKHTFMRPSNFPRTSPSNRWRKAADLVPKAKTVGWKDLFKRLASGSVSPVPLRPTIRSSASLTIKPVLATPTPDDTDILQRLEMSPDKAAQARSVAEQAVSSIESLLQERKRSQALDDELQTYAPTPPVSHPISSPLHSGVPYLSPPSFDASSACMQTSAALVTIISRQNSGDHVTTEPSDLTSAPSLPPSAVYATAGTSRSCTPSQLGSLAKIKEDVAVSSPEADRSAEHVSDPEGQDDVQARLRASWAGRLSEVGMRVHSLQDIEAGGTDGCTLQLAGIEVEEIEIGQSDSEDLLLPMAPLSTAAKAPHRSFRLDQQSGAEGKSPLTESVGQESHGQPHDLAAVSDHTMGSQTIYSFGCGQPRGSASGVKSP